ncbi:MAG: TatD family hydrolase [Candidatus Saccharimonadales bacterium]
MELADTHCHIHFKSYPLEPGDVIATAKQVGVTRLLLVGTTLPDSVKAIELASDYDNIWAAAGCHPHDANAFMANEASAVKLAEILSMPKVVAVGETGLDYFRRRSSKENQQLAFRQQIEAGLTRGLPYVFHVREAWEDFFAILDEYNQPRALSGVVHSFSAGPEELDQILSRGLYVGLNGIMTFTKDELQLQAAKTVPIDKLLLETDAPFLTPHPHRGEVCQPAHIADIAKFLADLRAESLDNLAVATTNNAINLFKL